MGAFWTIIFMFLGLTIVKQIIAPSGSWGIASIQYLNVNKITDCFYIYSHDYKFSYFMKTYNNELKTQIIDLIIYLFCLGISLAFYHNFRFFKRLFIGIMLGLTMIISATLYRLHYFSTLLIDDKFASNPYSQTSIIFRTNTVLVIFLSLLLVSIYFLRKDDKNKN